MANEASRTSDDPRDQQTLIERVRARALQWARDRATDGSAWLDAEASLLGPLATNERLLLLSVIGPAAHAGVEADATSVEARTLAIGAGVAVLTSALSGKHRTSAALERRWREAISMTGARAQVAGTALAIGGALPLSVEDPPQVAPTADPVVASLLGLTLGRAARAGDPGATRLARELLEDGPPALQIGVLKGLGDGLWRDGLRWLAHRANHDVFAAAGWGAAARRVSLLGLSATPDAVMPIIQAGLAAAPTDEVASRFLAAALSAADGEAAREIAALAVTRWTAWPPHVRAALFDLEAYGIDVPYACWEIDRSPAVITRVLALLGARPDVDVAQQRRLYRRWAHHQDQTVRRAVAKGFAATRKLELVAMEPAAGGAEVISMPASILAREPLDRLHAALFGGDSDEILPIVLTIELEDRPRACEALFRATEVPNAALRRVAVEAIGLIGEGGDGARLMAVARSYRALEGTVAAALHELGAKQEAEPLAKLYNRRLKWADDDAVDDYCAISGPERVMHLLGALQTRFYPGARAGAARAIARSRAHEVVFALRNRGLSDTQEVARMASLSALQELTGSAPSAAEMAGYALLFKATDGLDEAVERAREAGAAALPGIRRTLAKGSWKRRRAACYVLSAIPTAEAEAVLLETLLDPDEDVRMTAMEALMERAWEPRTPREHTLFAVAARRPRILSERPELLHIETLERALSLGGHVFRTELLDVLERLPAWRPSPHGQALAAATRLDGEAALAARDGLKAVLGALDHTWQAVPHRARLVRSLGSVPAAGLVVELLESGWGWRAREALCRSLGREGDDAGIAGLATAVLDEDDDVRRAALEALATIATTSAAEGVARGFSSPFQEDRELVALAMAAVGDAALPVLKRLIDDAWWEGRQGAALSLRAWRGDRQQAADLLIQLAVDAEYRVFQPAREGLALHGVMPGVDAIAAAVERAQNLTVQGLETWLGAYDRSGTSPSVQAALTAMVGSNTDDALSHRLGLIPMFGAEHLHGWLEDAAQGRRGQHVGLRLAAAEALRSLVQRECTVCHGERAVICPECDGTGDTQCPRCDGRGAVWAPCPDADCTAQQVTRRIDSRRCSTCKGRGQLLVPCVCAHEAGRVSCSLCNGRARIGCVACEGGVH